MSGLSNCRGAPGQDQCWCQPFQCSGMLPSRHTGLGSKSDCQIMVEHVTSALSPYRLQLVCSCSCCSGFCQSCPAHTSSAVGHAPWQHDPQQPHLAAHHMFARFAEWEKAICNIRAGAWQLLACPACVVKWVWSEQLLRIAARLDQCCYRSS